MIFRHTARRKIPRHRPPPPAPVASRPTPRSPALRLTYHLLPLSSDQDDMGGCLAVLADYAQPSQRTGTSLVSSSSSPSVLGFLAAPKIPLRDPRPFLGSSPICQIICRPSPIYTRQTHVLIIAPSARPPPVRAPMFGGSPPLRTLLAYTRALFAIGHTPHSHQPSIYGSAFRQTIPKRHPHVVVRPSRSW